VTFGLTVYVQYHGCVGPESGSNTMKIANHFRLAKTQAELDFVNIDVRHDTPVFVDPYAIEIRNDEWSALCGDHLRSFFSSVLEALRTNHESRALQLVSHLQEPRETFLGVSKGKPQGRGLGAFQGNQLLDALARSRAVETGVLSDIAEAELFVEGIGPDKMSDLTTNIIRGPLIDYTVAQCNLHNIPVHAGCSVGAVWDPARETWRQQYHSLPKIGNQPIILVPKYSVRQRLSIDGQEFYNHHMVEFLQAEHISVNSSLVHVLRSGERVVYKKDVKQQHPFIKNDLADFVRKNPTVLAQYKRLKGASGTMTIRDFDESFDENAFAEALLESLRGVRPGNDDAGRYHSLMIGVLEFLFFPSLIYPFKEHEINEGRKRIDIKYTNAARSGFFFRMLQSPQARAISVFVECKNYSKDLANPELDQLSGRFGLTRGFFGLLCCRSFSDKRLFEARCRDTAKDQHHFIIVLDDDDIAGMLTAISTGRRRNIDVVLQRKFDYLCS